MQWPMLLPLLSVLVLPIGRLEYAWLRRSHWAAFLAGVAVTVLYVPWLVGAILDGRMMPSAAGLFIGGGLAAAGLLVWLSALPPLMRVPGQRNADPQSLVTDGAYSWTRHPLYVGHVAVISGLVLCLGAPRLFLETPLLWLIAAVAARFEERQILAVKFPGEYGKYRRRVPFLLSARGWAIWGSLYVAVAVLSSLGLLGSA